MYHLPVYEYEEHYARLWLNLTFKLCVPAATRQNG